MKPAAPVTRTVMSPSRRWPSRRARAFYRAEGEKSIATRSRRRVCTNSACRARPSVRYLTIWLDMRGRLTAYSARSPIRHGGRSSRGWRRARPMSARSRRRSRCRGRRSRNTFGCSRQRASCDASARDDRIAAVSIRRRSSPPCAGSRSIAASGAKAWRASTPFWLKPPETPIVSRLARGGIRILASRARRSATLRITRRDKASPERVFSASVDPRSFAKRWGPRGFTLPSLHGIRSPALRTVSTCADFRATSSSSLNGSARSIRPGGWFTPGCGSRAKAMSH